MSFNRSGYIGRAPGDSAITIARKTYEPTGVQTDFTFSAGYDPGYCDVYLNGIRLINGNDYTASNGSTVGLTSEAQSGDIVEIVAYKAFNLGQTVSDITGNLTVSDTLTVGSVSASSSITGTLFGDGANITGLSYAGIGVTQYIDANSITVTGTPGLSTITRLGATNAVVTGIITANGLSGNISGAACTFTDAGTFNSDVSIGGTLTVTGSVSVGGTLSYQDVTNVDSIGVVTARSGVNVSGGQLLVGSGVTIGNAGVATFSGTGDVHLLDNVKLLAGDGSDLSIWHNGSHSYIQESGSGALQLRGANLILDNADGSKRYIDCNDGSDVHIFYNNSKKWETTNDGTVTTGIATATGGLEINADSKYLKIGAGGDLQLFHNGTNSLVKNTTGDLVLESDSLKLRSATGGESYIQCTLNGSVDLRYNDSLKLVTTNDGVAITGIATATKLILNESGAFNDADEYLLVKNTDGACNLSIVANNTDHSSLNMGDEDDFNVGKIRYQHTDNAMYFFANDAERLRVDENVVRITGFTSTTAGMGVTGGLFEGSFIKAGKLSDNKTLGISTANVFYFTTQETTTATPDIRWNDSNTLSSKMNVGDVASVTVITTAAAGGYSANWTIDGNAVTEEWVGGSAPSAGGSNGLDIYSLTIIKTGTGTGDSGFKVIANVSNAT